MSDKIRKRILFWSLIATAWVVCISGVFGNNGLLQAYQLNKLRREMNMRVRALANEKNRLEFALSALETDPLVQENAVRETLGYVRDQELVLEFR